MGQKEIVCCDCAVGFMVETGLRSGNTPVRCQLCREAHVRTQNRDKSLRYRLAHPDRVKEQWTRANLKQREKPGHLQSKRERARRDTYGVAPDDFLKMVDSQNGLCIICGLPPTGRGRNDSFHIDHCHLTGKIRGLLCGNCNTMIGLAKENPDTLRRAIQYLQGKE